VGVAALAARDIENARASGELEELYDPRDFVPVVLWRKKWAVLEEIVGVECRLPPLARFPQKKTGSR
jgi:hypothetical protein